MMKIEFGKLAMQKPSENVLANPKNWMNRAELNTEENNSNKIQLSQIKDNLHTTDFKDQG